MRPPVLFLTTLIIAAFGFNFAGIEAQETPAKKEEPKAAAPAPSAKAPAPAAPSGAAAPLLPKPPANNPKAIEVVNRYIDALGGAKVLEAITDRVQKFRNVKHAATGDTVAALNQYIKKGYKVREEWDIEGVKIKENPLAFTQVYNGMDGWVQMFGTVSPLEGRTLSLFVWDKQLDDPFCHWEEDGYNLDYVGAGTVDKEQAEIVEMSDYSVTKRERFYFSKESGLLLKKEWKEQGQNGLAKKEIAYKKYRKIPFSDNPNLSLPFALLHEVYDDGDIDTTREFTEVKINSGLSDSIFERPPGEEFKGAIGGPPPGLKTPSERAAEKASRPPAGGHPPIPPKAEAPPRPPAVPPAPVKAPEPPAKAEESPAGKK